MSIKAIVSNVTRSDKQLYEAFKVKTKLSHMYEDKVF